MAVGTDPNLPSSEITYSMGPQVDGKRFVAKILKTKNSLYE